MKKNILVCIVFLVCLNGWSQTYSDKRVLGNSDNLESQEYACESFILKHGFVFSSKTQPKGLSLSIDSRACVPAEKTTTISDDVNYVLSITPLDEIQNVKYEDGVVTVSREGAKDPKYLTEINYIDGFGETMQNVQLAFSPQKSDISTVQSVYTSWVQETLPIPLANNNGKFSLASEVESIGQAIYADLNPYVVVIKDPRTGEIVSEHGPGQDWMQKDSTRWTNRNVSYNRSITSGNEKIKKITISKSNDVYTLSIGASYYPAGALVLENRIDEDGKGYGQYTDAFGKLILERRGNGALKKIEDEDIFDTQYVYDVAGNLCAVLPPLAVDALKVGNVVNDDHDILKKYVYLYKYDARGRCVRKKLPGCDWIDYVYDGADRVILSQDGEQRKQGKWSFTKYDAFGRVILEGEQIINKSVADLHTKYKNEVVKEGNGVAYGYSWTTLSDVTSAGVLLVNHYDDYDYLLNQDPLFRESLSYTKKDGFGEYYIGSADQKSPKGFLTGTRVKLLGEPGEIVTTFYHDIKGRIVQTKSKNHKGGLEHEYLAYNFAGSPLIKLHEHVFPEGKTLNIAGSPIGLSVGTHKQLDELYVYEYDHSGRLLKTVRNGEAIAQNVYEETGRLKSKKQGNMPALSTQYTYNIRGWVTDISERNTQFNQKLSYNVIQNSMLTSKKYYNGNISQIDISYKDADSPYSKQYQLASTYDNLSRVLYFGGIDLDSANEFGERMQYDKHGNIIELVRNHDNITVDRMTIEHSGNQMLSLTNVHQEYEPNVTQYPSDESFFTYNENGALISDLGRGIALVEYNSLNSPKTIRFTNGNTIYYSYSATGQKLRSIHQTAKQGVLQPILNGEVRPLKDSEILSTLVTDYLGNVVYEDGVPQMMSFDGGYVKIAPLQGVNYTANSHYYQYDHLGNIRQVVSSAGVVASQTDYHAFGTPYKKTDKEYQRYKYSGKEFDQMHGLDWYDFHARQYDPLLSRFMSIDPLAEKYYSWSPYAYCLNNPLIYKDPTGKWVAGTNGKPVTFSDKKGWSKNASADVQRGGNALLKTETGTTQLNNMLGHSEKISITINTGEAVMKDNGNYSIGTTESLGAQQNARTGEISVKEHAITINEGSIKPFLNPNASNDMFKGLTLEEAIGAALGHEAVHTEKENVKISFGVTSGNVEEKPMQVQNKIADESRENKK